MQKAACWANFADFPHRFSENLGWQLNWSANSGRGSRYPSVQRVGQAAWKRAADSRTCCYREFGETWAQFKGLKKGRRDYRKPMKQRGLLLPDGRRWIAGRASNLVAVQCELDFSRAGSTGPCWVGPCRLGRLHDFPPLTFLGYTDSGEASRCTAIVNPKRVTFDELDKC